MWAAGPTQCENTKTSWQLSVWPLVKAWMLPMLRSGQSVVPRLWQNILAHNTAPGNMFLLWSQSLNPSSPMQQVILMATCNCLSPLLPCFLGNLFVFCSLQHPR